MKEESGTSLGVLRASLVTVCGWVLGGGSVEWLLVFCFFSRLCSWNICDTLALNAGSSESHAVQEIEKTATPHGQTNDDGYHMAKPMMMAMSIE